jgi:hypothetical protein
MRYPLPRAYVAGYDRSRTVASRSRVDCFATATCPSGRERLYEETIDPHDGLPLSLGRRRNWLQRELKRERWVRRPLVLGVDVRLGVERRNGLDVHVGVHDKLEVVVWRDVIVHRDVHGMCA